VDRQVPVLDGECQDAHRGTVLRAEHEAAAVTALPGAVRGLVPQQRLVERRAIELPVVVAELEHGLRTVVDGVIEVLLAPARWAIDQVTARVERFRAAVPFFAANL